MFAANFSLFPGGNYIVMSNENFLDKGCFLVIIFVVNKTCLFKCYDSFPQCNVSNAMNIYIVYKM